MADIPAQFLHFGRELLAQLGAQVSGHGIAFGHNGIHSFKHLSLIHISEPTRLQ